MVAKTNRGMIVTAVLSTAVLLAATQTPALAAENKIQAVLWIGGFAHDFEASAKVIVPALEKRLSIEIPVVRDGSFLDEPRADQLDVIVMLHCHKSTEGVLTEKQKGKLLKLIKGGVGVVALHASYYSFLEWNECHELYGARFTKHGSSKAVIVVRTVDKNHPITKGLTGAFEVVTELYQSTPPAEDCHILALARERDSKEEYPSVWTRAYGQGRVVTILPGHWPDSYKVPDFQRLIAASTTWAAARTEPAKTSANKKETKK